MRIAVIDKELCHSQKCGGYLCARVCPVNRMGEECITTETKVPVIHEELCTGCGICPKKCPFEAISIINLPHELEEPFHRYGVNSFRVYGIPAPANGVVGLVGPNGIGKTTILKALSGKMIPNLGDYGEEAAWGRVLEHYEGSEVQKYFKNVAQGRVKLSYKPQDVSQLPKHFKGTVGELLEETDEKGKKEDFIRALELEKALDRKLSEASGGELQRAAIAATALRKAEFYFFDEPTSYLDVRQRLNAARLIKDLSSESTVFVVEHDLAALDYLTDFVYILFGEAGVFGVVSSLKNSRSGINEFLEGFLTAENMRIRDHSIHFDVKPPASEWKGKEKYSYKGFTKEYKGFKLTVQGAEAVKGEVIGILGPNAIGKSTYMKVLAGEEKPTSGSPGFKARISYKPQYLSADFEGTVSEYIRSQKSFDFALFDSELKRDVHDLLEKRVDELSGGELQRVAITTALGRECEICLLDEPSAFLDIEQRMRLAQVIKKITEKKEVTTLVIDHDIVFQDMVANRIMIFYGTPGVEGEAGKPVSMKEGMSTFLKDMDITFRRDENTKRPRVNKPGSQKDAQQRKKGEYYYTVS